MAAFLLSSFLPLAASALPVENITFPSGTTDHGVPNLLCTPSTWFTVVTFFLSNYVSHAATVQTYPGEAVFDQALSFWTSLLFPASGVARGLNSVARGILIFANRGGSDLQKAAAAGALCMVVRTNTWTPVAGHTMHAVKVSGESDLSKATWNVYVPDWVRSSHSMLADTASAAWRKLHLHGASQRLPEGYAFAFVPPTAVISTPGNSQNVQLAYSLNNAKIILSIFQTVSSTYVLYRARGDQIERYGYVAFSLTVAPYVVMSLVNLLGSLLTPTYTTVYIVRSEVTDELESRHGRWFDGTVGTLATVTDHRKLTFSSDGDKHLVEINGGTGPIVLAPECCSPGTTAHISIPACAEFPRLPWRFSFLEKIPSPLQGGLVENTLINLVATFVVSVGAPLAIIGGLSGFQPGGSTLAQRVWIMTWMVFGWVYGLGFGIRMYDVPSTWRTRWGEVAMRALVAAPAIGGFVVVGQMIMDYGSCVYL
ncbi:hypothetical protein DFS33DRAFT_1386457 [Desarmillaria ectypa]|nr:hypothetical protein DFS33DRAFT_1386457 [Desarmillaria ectypa]